MFYNFFCHNLAKIIFCESIKSQQKLNVELQQVKPGQLAIPQLRKVVRDPKEAPKKAEEKELKEVKKPVKKKKMSDYELPEIPDYERPELEKYEKSDFDPLERVSLKNTISKKIDEKIHPNRRPYVKSQQNRD